MVVLDTNVVSAAMRHEAAVLERLAGRSPDELVLPSPVVAEICYGIERLPAGSRRRALLQQEFDRLRRVLRPEDWSVGAAEIFGEQKAALENRGETIEDMDLAIGAIALHLGATLATGNAKHFRRMNGLVMEDWTT